MKRFLLDTAPLAAYLNKREVMVSFLQPLIDRHAVVTSMLVYGEVVEYLYGLAHPDRRVQELRQLLQVIVPYFLTYPILERYALLRRQLRPPYGKGLIGSPPL